MNEYTVESISVIKNTVVANCYNNNYDETFKKYIGKLDSEKANLRAQDLLNDTTFYIPQTIREELQELFNIEEFVDDDF